MHPHEHERSGNGETTNPDSHSHPGVVALAIVSLAIALSHNSPCGATPSLPAGTQRMKAIVYRCYGAPDVLKLEEIARPTLENDRVLLRVTRQRSIHSSGTT
jgi:hypothetical protein